MKTLAYELLHDNEAQPAIGLVVLQSDETLEHELRHWLPGHFRLFHTRIPNQQHINSDTLLAMQAALPQSLSLLPSHTRFRVIAYGCTSASTVIGEQAVCDAIQEIFPNCAATNPISAIKAKLKYLKALRIALLTPYEPAVTATLADNLEAAGYTIVHALSFNETQDHRVARISPRSLNEGIDAIGGAGDVDAVVASCTNLRTLDIIDSASRRINCPVISSNSALAWHVEALVKEHATD